MQWQPFKTNLWPKWLREIDERDREEGRRRQAKIDAFRDQQEMRRKWRTGEITQEEYDAFRDQQETAKYGFV